MAKILDGMGVTYYLPVQKVVKQYSDRKKKVDKLVIPRVIFMFTTELVRRQLIKNIPNFIFHSCMSRDGNVIRIPQSQIDDFRMMVESPCEVVPITPAQFVAGEKVRIKSGALKDRVVQITQIDGKHCVAMNLDGLGAFAISISVDCLEKVSTN